MSKKITLENVDSSELPEIPVIGEVKQIRFTQDMELVSTLADSDLFMIQAGADLEARPNTITFDLIIKNLSGPIEEGSKKFVTGDMMFKVIGDMNLLDTWDNTNLVSSLNATYVNVRRIEEELRREINRSTEKDDLHDTQIANLRQDLTSTNEMLNQEINRSVAKDNEHDELLEGLRDDVDSTSAKLDAEIDRSTAKDAEHDTLLKGLRVDVNANKSAIDSEVARSTARDEAHDAAISKNASDIATESSRAKAEEAKIRQEMKTADTNLQNAITAETERATGVEEDLQRQITDLSGSTDDRLEALEALSHEQNTDTGTTSKTFVIDSGNTGAMLKAEGGGLSTRTKGDAGYANFTVQNLVIKGDVTQEGDTFITQAERVEVRDNMILINEGETGAGVTAGFAGIEVDRGTEQNFMFGFNESDGMFKIGKEGNMFDVALRQPVGDMIDGMFASWDAATKTFKTTNLIPPTLKLYLGTNNVDISYNEADSGSIRLRTNGQSLNIFTKNGYTNFRSTLNKLQFIGDVSIYTGKLYTSADTFNIIVAGGNRMVIDGTGSTLSTPLTANSFFRSSDNAEVLYATDITTLTDGMFLSWDETNKKVVTTNKVPYGGKLYLAFDDVYITQDGRSIEFHTNDYWWRANTSSSNTMFSSSSGLFDFSGNIIVNNKVQTTASTLRLETTGKCLSIGNNGTSTLDTTLKANTFYRFSDSSEVLYQADLKSVLTGKETNYAPTVKAVSDAIDAVNTGTTESLKGYLKLSGGTMTGPIIMNNSIVLKSKDNNGVERRLIGKSIEGTTHIGDIDGKAQIYTSDVDVIHFRSTGSYKILDSYNLPDPATKSGNNSFTGTNSFVGGKFSVDGSESGVYVTEVGSLVSRSTYGNMGWIRSLEFSDNNVVVARFGVKAITTDNVPTTDFVGILVGDGSVNDSQYKFRTNKLTVPESWSMIDGKNDAITLTSNSSIFGRISTPLYLRGDNTDLFHTKNSTDYKVWDASNLPDPATKSGNNSFTGTNSFVGGKFSVDGSESGVYVTEVGSLVSRSTYGNMGWIRSLEFSDNNVVVARFGVKAITTDNVPTTDFVGILVGDGSVNDSQYKFRTNKLTVPESWSMIDGKNDAITLTSNSSIFGRISTPLYLRGDNTDLFHTKNSTNYKVWDASNLPTPASTSDIPDVSDMARRSEANTFTANNTFTAGQFNVGALEVSSSSSIVVNLSGGGEWARTLSFLMESDTSSQICFGAHSNTTNTNNYAYIGIGDVNNSTAQYRFYSNKVLVPETWTLADFNGRGILVIQDTTTSTFGRIDGTTYIRGGNTDLYHIKGSTNYKILDESNYSQYLPTTSKWTYGFVTINPGGNNVDFNTVLSGPDSPKILLNYNHQLGNDTNAPTDMKYGAVLQIDGNYNSRFNNVALRPQLAFDINHDVENGTRYMWFRTGNNLGYGDSSNWKRVLTADENVASLVMDKNTYPSIARIDGTTYNWLRTPTQGLLPNTQVTLDSGGTSYLGTKDWAFGYATIHTIYSKRYMFGDTGVDFRLDTNNKIAATISGSARGIEIGDLLVSSNYGADAVKVPTNGIFASGRIQSNDSMLVGYTRNITGGQLGYGLYYNGVSDGGLGSEYASGALILYKFVNPNIGSLGYNVPRAESGIPTYLKIIDGNLILGVGANKAYTAGEAVTINEYPMATKNWATNTFYPLAGKGYLSFDANGRPVMANNQGYSAKDKDGITREIMWVGPDNVIYMGNGGNSKAIIDIVFLYGGNGENSLNVSNIVQKRDLAKYLPLTGGTITDGLSVGANGSQPININNTNASATEVSQAFRIGGTSKGYFGYTTSTGVYMQNSDSSIICVKSNGAYFGTSTNTLTKLLTSTDLSGYATQSWVTSQGYLKSHQTIYALTFAAGAFAAKTFTPTSAAATVNIPTKTSHLTNDSGFLTSITKSMVTTALGYTPPTTNTTYSQATSSTLGLVKIGATGLAAKNYAVQLNSSGQMYVAVPWTDTNSTYSAATSSTYGLVKIGATGLAAKNYAVQLNSSGQMYVSVPWTDTDTNTHYTTRLYAGASGTAANAAASNPYLKVTDDNTYRNQVRFIGAGATSISSDASGNITITSTNTTYGLASSSSNGLMSSSQYTKLSNCIETVSAANMVTSVQVVDTIPGESSQVTGRLYLKFA